MHGHTVGLHMNAQLVCTLLLSCSIHEHQFTLVSELVPEAGTPHGTAACGSQQGRKEETHREAAVDVLQEETPNLQPPQSNPALPWHPQLIREQCCALLDHKTNPGERCGSQQGAVEDPNSTSSLKRFRKPLMCRQGPL